MTATVSSEALIALLEQERAGDAGALVAASDGDNTLWAGDVGEALFEHAVGRGLLKEAARAALLEEAAAHQLDVPDGDASAIGAALLAAHRRGAYPNRAAFTMMAWAFAGFSEPELEELSERVLDEIDFASACRRSMRDVLAWCARRDVPMWLVSASPQCVALAAARRLGIAHVVAMTPATDGTLLLPRLAGEPTYGDGKLLRLRQAVPNTRILAAFGDSYWDVAMMEEARFGVGVCPNDDMRRRLDELPNAYVLED